MRMAFLPLVSLASLSMPIAAGGPGESPPAAAAAPLVRIGEGSLLLYKGTLKVLKRQTGEEPEEYSASLEVGYLGLGEVPSGPQGAGADRRVLLFRSGESQEKEDVTFSEAVSLLAAPDFSLRPEFPAEDRAQRVSPFSFNHLPLGIFPPLSSAEPREWKGPGRLQVLFSETREISLRHRVEPAEPAGSVRYLIEAEGGQRLSFLQDRVEISFEVIGLKQAYALSPRDGRLLSFESRLAVRFPAGSGPGEAEERRVEIELVLSEASRLSGSRLDKIEAESEMVREIERALFVDLSPDVAESKASAFQKEHPSSRLASCVEGLERQAPAVWPIANERRLQGKPAPDFTLRDLAGKEATLSALLPGKVTLLVFWSAG